MTGRESDNAIVHAAGGYGPPGSGGGGGGYGGPPPGAPPGGGGYGGPPQGPPPGGGGPGGYGGPPPGGYGGGGFGSPPGGGYGGFGGGGGGFGPPGGGFAPPGGPMGPGMGDDINTTLPLALSIVAMLCCWGSGIGLILGIVGLVFSIQAGNAKKTGDMETARNKAKTALIVSIIALVAGLIGNSIVGFLRYSS